MRARRLMLIVLAVAAVGGGGTASAAGEADSLLSLSCQGVSVSVPTGWHGRVRRGYGGYFTLTLATFPLVPETDSVDEQSAKHMGRGDVLVLLIGYGPSEGGNPAFQAHPRLPLTVQAMTFYSQFEHLPYGHRLARKTFVARGNAYDVQVQFARTISPALRKRANGVLGLFHFSPPSRQTPSGTTRC
jgi:hypothetical protein